MISVQAPEFLLDLIGLTTGINYTSAIIFPVTHAIIPQQHLNTWITYTKQCVVVDSKVSAEGFAMKMCV